jgi:SRSO17 transposase
MTVPQEHSLSLRRFLRPFQRVLGHAQRRKWCPLYLRGLMSPLERKSPKGKRWAVATTLRFLSATKRTRKGSRFS